MAFPTTLDSITTPGQKLGTAAHLHTAQHNEKKAAIEALEAKVGVDSSAVVTSIDYLLRQRIETAGVYAASTTETLKARVVADTQDRLILRPDGIRLGSGAVAADVIIGRSGVAIMAITGAVTMTGDASAQLGAAAQTKIGAFGPASEAALKLGAAADTTLYRSAVNAIRTPGALTVDGAATITGALTMSAALNHDGTTVGFYGATPVVKQTVSGSRGGNAALADLLVELAEIGLITDSTT